jgi:hypothetical protein
MCTQTQATPPHTETVLKHTLSPFGTPWTGVEHNVPTTVHAMHTAGRKCCSKPQTSVNSLSCWGEGREKRGTREKSMAFSELLISLSCSLGDPTVIKGWWVAKGKCPPISIVRNYVPHHLLCFSPRMPFLPTHMTSPATAFLSQVLAHSVLA